MRLATLAFSVLLVTALSAGADSDKEKAAKPEANSPAWLTTLLEGRAQALVQRRPIFVVVGTSSCVWCRRLEKELKSDAVKKELERWVLVNLDLEKSENEVKPLLVAGTPALRIVTPAGRVLVSHDGYLAADKLAAWLKQHYDKAAALAPAELADAGPPSAVALEKILAELGSRDPLTREAAVRRLMPHPQTAAGPVAQAFVDGSLQTRLAALELLQGWNAPVKELDPWRPLTLSDKRLQALRDWAREPGKTVAPARVELSTDDLRHARHELARMLRGTDTEAAASRERLARHGSVLRAEVLAQLEKADTDQGRERLTALRYRLAASPARALEWSTGFERLAATADLVRQRAAQELAERAGADDEALLLELFTSPDPLVREISLRALQEIGGAQATNALAKLLSDPVPNVRAAVLKQLAQSPTPGMTAKVIEYVGQEKDTDLIVHAVRVLREAGGKSAIECLKGLLTHESWRVRAESADALANVANNNRTGAELQADIYAALLDVLDDRDGFVVSRALPGFKSSQLATAVDPLLKVVERHPELAVEVIKTIYASDKMRLKAQPTLLGFCTHANPEVRAAAIGGLTYFLYAQPQPEEELLAKLKAALKDEDTRVRQAAAATLYSVLANRRSAAREERPPDNVMDWVGRFFKAKASQPKWQAAFEPLLSPLLTAETPEERLQGALAEVALGQDAKAMPVLEAIAKSKPEFQATAASALSLLPWEKRLAFFNYLMGLRPDDEAIGSILYNFVSDSDKRAAPRLWELFQTDFVNDDVAGHLLSTLAQAHFGLRYYDVSQLSAADKKAVAEVAVKRAQSGPELQRLVAVALLGSFDFEQAGTAAKQILADDKASADLRGDAFQIYLLTRPRKEFHSESMAAMGRASTSWCVTGVSSRVTRTNGRGWSSEPSRRSTTTTPSAFSKRCTEADAYRTTSASSTGRSAR
jgi:HEAT repeat protein